MLKSSRHQKQQEKNQDGAKSGEYGGTCMISINHFKATVMYSSHCNHRLVRWSIVLQSW